MPIWRRGYPKGKIPQREDTVPWKQYTKLELKNEVSGQGDKGTESVCLQEMALMFTCLKDNDFKDSLCAQQMKTYQDCVFTHMKNKKQLKDQLQAGKLTPNSREQPRQLNHRQLNILLRKYPQFNYVEPKK